MSNYAWFQFQLNRLAAFVSQQHDLRSVVEQLKKAFPAREVANLLPSESFLRLESVAPGFTDQLGPLARPTSIPKVNVTACDDTTPVEGALSLIVIHNRTSREIVVSRAGKQHARIGAGQWQRVTVFSREPLRLSTGGCILALAEPTLAVIQTERY